ncbi:hypothetical protein AB685_17375 [Bacillus sp. LL01]|uniref:DUF2812 domain-containing protein n=1 Tax=Bacillus sp. LL01 TaxID=1665556 RepID=UPI00064D413C|nr:DUF2812 domain-containing protein [Bacillus sp. LL01]KMJ57181.1 hypothetical protein AB685_17375 [Bacillus sp. LL01]
MITKKARRNIFKNIFLDYEKEENWVNNMCKQGYALCEISNGYYYFEACDPGEYTYRIDFLKQGTISEKNTYLDSINEMKVDHIASINRWQYFRRKSILGEFHIHSDTQSKITHYQRVNFIWYILAIIFILPAFFLVSDLIVSFFIEIDIDQSGVFLNVALLLIGLFFLKQALPLTKKIRNLKNEQ